MYEDVTLRPKTGKQEWWLNHFAAARRNMVKGSAVKWLISGAALGNIKIFVLQRHTHNNNFSQKNPKVCFKITQKSEIAIYMHNRC